MGMTDQSPTRRRFCPTPAWLVLGLLVVEGLLWLSERFQCFAFNFHKGWTVLIAAGIVGLVFLVMLLWFIAALVFRRRFQFSIRTLLVLTVAVALPYSWLAVEKQAANRQRSVADEIIRRGGSVWYDYQFGPATRSGGIVTLIFGDGGYNSYFHQFYGYGNLLSNARPPVSPWLLDLLGDDFFADVVDATPFSTGPLSTDPLSTPAADLRLEPVVRCLPRLQHLFLSHTQVADAELEPLRGLPQLLELNLEGTQITDEGLKPLAGMSQLRWLTVASTGIGDAGLEHLKALGQLEWLGFTNTKVTDAGLRHLAGLTQLRWLDISSTAVGDAGLEHLRALGQLEMLGLTNTKVTDAGLERVVKGLARLHILDLQATARSRSKGWST